MKPAREPASSRPKPFASLKKPHEPCPFAAPCGSRRKKMTVARHRSFSLRNLAVQACVSRAQGFSPLLARRRSSCPPPSPNLMRTYPIEHYQALRDSAPCLSRAATLPKGTKLELGSDAHLETPPSIAKAASWLHLLRVSPALHPPERPSHTHTPKPGFGGRGHKEVAKTGNRLVCVKKGKRGACQQQAATVLPDRTAATYCIYSSLSSFEFNIVGYGAPHDA